MALYRHDKEVRVLKITPDQYAVMFSGERIGSALKLNQHQWRLVLDSDPPGRKRRPFASLRTVRDHVLALSFDKMGGVR